MMNCYHKKLIFLLFLSLLLSFNFIFIYSHASEIQEITDLAEQTPDTITIASEPDYPPYCIVDEDGNADGFSVELFKAAADATGLKVNIKIGIWSQIKQDLAEGRIDALPLVGRTPEREEIFYFTIPYLSLHGAVFVRQETDDIHSLEDLKNKQIAVMKGDNAEEFVRRENISSQIHTTNTFEEAFRELADGNFDAVITQKVMGLHLLEEMGLKKIKVLDLQLPEFRQDFCFAVQKGNEQLLARLNEGLSIVIADGTYDRIRFKWFGPQIIEEIPLQKVLTIALYIFIPLFIVFLISSISVLRRQVNKRTRSLYNEVEEHKKTLDTLRKQKLLLNKMEKVSKIGGWEYDVESEKVNRTDGVYEIYGVSRENYNFPDYDRDIAFYAPEERKKLDMAFKHALKTATPYDLVLRFNSYDGTEKWIHTSGQAEMENGKVKRLYGNIADITDQVKIESELRKLKDELEEKVTQRTAQLEEQIGKLDKSQKALLYMIEDLNEITAALKAERKKLEEANQELEAFTYSVSHDLRAPLRTINGFSSFLLEDYFSLLDEEGKRYINIIRYNASKMDQLITDLLNLSRIYRTAVKLAEINMGELVKSIYHEVATEKEKEEFDIIINDMPVVKCDSSLMKQVWQNLFENALKYSSKSEKKKIIIGSKKENNETTFFIKDSGVGFNSKYINKLFGVFQRLHREEEFEGTGIGLAIVKRIITRHEGKVWAEGEINQGATFYFTLPDKD